MQDNVPWLREDPLKLHNTLRGFALSLCGMDAFFFLQEKSSGLKLNFAIPDQRPFKLQEKLAEEDHDLIMALGRQALKERRAAQELSDKKKVML